MHNFALRTESATLALTPSDHCMTGGTPGFDCYNLPGISWVSYFRSSGIDFHGAYWPNDFGKPRSHGCVNMLPEDMPWEFRWTQPACQASERRLLITKCGDGSMVKVF